MALKTIGKSQTSKLEKDVRMAMINHDVSQVEIAEHEGVTGQAIYNRMKRLNYERAVDIRKIIRKIAADKKEHYTQKATG